MGRYNTPLRYPGGKQRLAPFLAELLSANDLRGAEYAEPYAGGAGAAIQLLLDGHVSKIHLNDSCIRIYSLWKTILTQPDELCRRILTMAISIRQWRMQREVFLEPKMHSQFDVGLSAIFLNRCNRSGIMRGWPIGGLKQDGDWTLDARFPRKELVRRIQNIAEKRESITVKNWDAERFLSEAAPKLPEASFIYCDPPYYRKAERLYLNHYNAEDHKQISRVIQTKVKKHWAVSYDSVPEIMELYSDRQQFTYRLQYNAAAVYKGKEVFICSDELSLPKNSQVTWIAKHLPSKCKKIAGKGIGRAQKC